MDDEKRIDIERFRGERMHNVLSELLPTAGINTDAIRDYGGICLDVQYGPEIEMLRLFGAPQIIACEPDEFFDDHNKFEIQQSLGRGLNIRVIRDFASSALGQLKSEIPSSLPVGLVTRLHAFPDNRLDGQNVAGIITAALPLISLDGGIVISAIEESRFILPHFEEAIEIIGQEAAVSLLVREPSSAGTTFLVARHPKR